MLLSKWLVRYPALYEAPKGNQPPPFLIRALMVLTCTGVSFFHGSNDGQKGMGLIMLILIGTVPTATRSTTPSRRRISRTSSPHRSGPDTFWTGTWTRPASWALTRAPM